MQTTIFVSYPGACSRLHGAPETRAESNRLAIDCNAGFENSSAVTSALPALREREGVTARGRCYAGCCQAANYAGMEEA